MFIGITTSSGACHGKCLGINPFPSAVEEVVRSAPRIGTEFQTLLDDSLRDSAGSFAGTKLKAEVEAGDSAELGLTLAHLIHEKIRVQAEVQIVPFGTLPRTMHKAKCVIKARNENRISMDNAANLGRLVGRQAGTERRCLAGLLCGATQRV